MDELPVWKVAMTRSKVKELELPPIASAIVAHALCRYWHVIHGRET